MGSVFPLFCSVLPAPCLDSGGLPVGLGLEIFMSRQAVEDPDCDNFHLQEEEEGLHGERSEWTRVELNSEAWEGFCAVQQRDL